MLHVAGRLQASRSGVEIRFFADFATKRDGVRALRNGFDKGDLITSDESTGLATRRDGVRGLRNGFDKGDLNTSDESTGFATGENSAPPSQRGERLVEGGLAFSAALRSLRSSASLTPRGVPSAKVNTPFSVRAFWTL